VFKWLGDSNEKELRHLRPIVDSINQLEPEFKKLSDDGLRAKTDEFRVRLADATAGIRQRIAEAKGELEAANQRTAQAQNEFQREEDAAEAKRLQNRVDLLEKESGEKESQVLDELLPEAFAAVREAARRTIGQRHFDVQLMGGIVLHQGKIAEMKTGEGKTLVATLPLYLNSLTGRGAHLVTVNDYLARRDPYWMGPIYHALGVSVASIYPMQNPDEHTPALLYDPDYDSGDKRWPHFRSIPRQEAYRADIAYGTSSEFGFDYLRDNMVSDLSQCVQLPLNYAIVDEVDNLLIDEARTPLIISGMAKDASQLYKAVDNAVSHMKPLVNAHEPSVYEREEEDALENQYDYIAYEKEHYARATARGQEKLARAFGLKADELFGGESGLETKPLTPEEAEMHNNILSVFRNSMLAHALYKRDRQYVVDRVEDGRPGIVIVDEFTGRKMYGRRYSEGLHQAIEAKEHIEVRRESMTYATITIQNYFRMYQKLAGMTGTAITEAEEFHKIYKLEVVVIPTNMPMIREDLPDQIYKTEEAKFNAVVRDVEQLHKENRPVLIGTVSIEKSEYLSEQLKRKGISCQVLNAKEHTKEGEIIAQAGKPGTVTVATNMAGRGVDIILGGHQPEKPESQDEAELGNYKKQLKDWEKNHTTVIEKGGLHIIGTERHEARRIDYQLRGRSGRQGDPGSSRFYISLEDDIVRRFGGDRLKTVLGWVGMDEETPIENKWVSRAIEQAQVKVEGYHFDIRKHLVDYDDVVNTQRELIYEERRKILSGADLKSNILSMVKDELESLAASHTAGYSDSWDIAGLVGELASFFPLPPDLNAESLSRMGADEIKDKLIEQADRLYEQKERELGADMMRILERILMLQTIDRLWKEHLTVMDEMRQGIGLQAAGQQDPLVAYKRQGHDMFQSLLAAIQHDMVHLIYRASIAKKGETPPGRAAPTPVASQPQPQAQAQGGEGRKRLKVAGKKVGRNDPCPCGSGKKYKHCCGR
jgi:preprotein translocase subunit SecA